MRQTAAAIDIGTSKVVCMIAEKGVYDGFNLLGISVNEYAGYDRSGWLEPRELKYTISSVLREAEKQAGRRLRRVHVGVPGDFTEVILKKASLSFGKARRITQDDVELLFKRGENFSAMRDYSVAHRCPIHFLVNGERKTMDPLNMMASELSAMVSYVLVNKGFMRSVGALMESEGYVVDSAVASPLAQALAFIPAEMRDRTSILVDIGNRSTSISVLKGDGMLYHNSVRIGGLHITRDLAMLMHVDDEIAEQLKRRAVYGLSVSRDDVYELLPKGSSRIQSFSAMKVQEIINARVDEICDIIKKELEQSGCILPEYVEIWLTGGTSGMRGIREFMQKRLNRGVSLIQPKSTRLNKPEYSSALGVIDLALDNITQEEVPLLEQIKQIFKK
ncbi:MAG: cell division protein FtsA [Christensenellaceae bacterium]|nr:cell division protein FtsA [Christensenellaceae bacterium]